MSGLIAAIFGFGAVVLFMLALQPLAIAVGLVDKPIGRKSHQGVVPIVGGLAMFGGVIIGIEFVPDIPKTFDRLLISGGLLVIIGVLDDRFDLPAATRFLAQVLAILAMIYGGGLMMHDIGDPLWIGTIGLGPLALVLTVIMALTVVNSFNLIDGIDGLAGVMALIAMTGIGIVSYGSFIADVAMVASGCILGFLVFNYPVGRNRNFRSFMGDAGSVTLGFMIVWLTISICQGEERLVSPVVALWLVSVPLFDLLTCFVRRLLKKKSPLTGGRDHIHHTLRRGGLSDREILGTLSILALIYALIGVSGHFWNVHESALFMLWCVAGMSQFVVIRKISALIRATRRQRFAGA